MLLIRESDLIVAADAAATAIALGVDRQKALLEAVVNYLFPQPEKHQMKAAMKAVENHMPR